MAYDLRLYNGQKDDNDPKIITHEEGMLPFLYFTDSFLEAHALDKQTINIGDSKNKLYYKGTGDDDDIDNDYVFQVKSRNNIVTTVFLDKLENKIKAFSMIDDVDPSDWRYKSIDVMTYSYLPDMINGYSTNSLLLPAGSNYRKVTDIKSLKNRTVTLYTLDLANMALAGRINRIKQNDPQFYMDLRPIEVMAVKKSDLGINEDALVYYTVYDYAFGRCRMRFIGDKDIDTIFIPVL